MDKHSNVLAVAGAAELFQVLSSSNDSRFNRTDYLSNLFGELGIDDACLDTAHKRLSEKYDQLVTMLSLPETLVTDEILLIVTYYMQLRLAGPFFSFMDYEMSPGVDFSRLEPLYAAAFASHKTIFGDEINRAQRNWGFPIAFDHLQVRR